MDKGVRKKVMPLVLFFTRHSSLSSWDQAGLLSREVQLYKRLRQQGIDVTFVTYGNRDDLKYLPQLSGIKVICNRWSFPQKLYIRLLPILIRVLVGRNWIGKSNQCLGAEIGLAVAGKNHKFVARNGYLFSLNEERSHGSNSVEANNAKILESKVFTNANRVVVTTETMKAEILQRYAIGPEKIVVIPNFVDVELFSPSRPTEKNRFTLCYVGRLTKNKNPLSLLEAIRGIDLKLVLVGGGGLLHELEEQARSQESKVFFKGFVPNEKLPQILNTCDLFVLPSYYEGQPKSLLEAMACGLPVIATNVPGNRELIRHGIDGYLCGTSPDEIRSAILTLIANRPLRQNLGKNARHRVVSEFSLDRVLELELNLLKELSLTDD